MFPCAALVRLLAAAPVCRTQTLELMNRAVPCHPPQPLQYWIFIGLNRISPGAVVTIKQLDRH